MKRLRKILRVAGWSFLVLFVLYWIGPTPALPTFADKLPTIAGSPAEIAARLATRESQVPHLKPDNQARIVWADSTRKEATEYCVVYLHGFFASYREGMPTASSLAKHYKANRLSGMCA